MHGLARHFKSLSVSLCERTVINYTFESQLLQLLKVIHYKKQITNVLALGASLLRTPSVISIKYISMWESFLKIYFQENFTPFPSNQLANIESYCFSCLKAHAHMIFNHCSSITVSTIFWSLFYNQILHCNNSIFVLLYLITIIL